MKAGKTDLEVGTLVRITKIADRDPEAQAYVGLEGEITHPFPGYMTGSGKNDMAGLHISDEMAEKFGLGRGPLGGSSMNLLRGDEYEIVEPTAVPGMR